MSVSRPRWLPIALVACAQACATGLPSETPLGSGPLARTDAAAVSSESLSVRDAGALEAGAALSTSKTDPPPASPEAERADAATASAKLPADAGAAEAGARAQFAGTYAGKDRAVIRMSGKPEQVEDDPKARISVAEQGSDAIAITLINSSDGKPICTLNARREGDRAEVTPGQPCFASGPGVSSTVQRGSATLAGKRLTVDLLIEMRLSMGGKDAAGSIDYHYEGTRE